mgnify:CR=1 FL=1
MAQSFKSLADASALAPLKERTFRMLWLAWLAANLTMWMNDVAAAWLMTTLTTSPVMVALVQTASTLPVFLLGLPSGALADILERIAQFHEAGVARAIDLTSRLFEPALMVLIGLVIGAIVVLGGLGYAADRWFGSAPWGAFSGLMLGLVVGFYELVKSVRR